MQRLVKVYRLRSFSAAIPLWGVALLAAFAAAAIDLLIARIATPIVYAPDDYPSFTWLPILAGCLLGAVGGYIVLMIMRRMTQKPVRRFVIVAIVVLIASYMLPILPIIHPLPRFAGVNWGIALTLMVMHTFTAAIIVASLLAFGDKLPTHSVLSNKA